MGVVALAVAGFGLAMLSWWAPAASAATRAPSPLGARLAGSIDLVETTTGSIRVAGWALDPRGAAKVGIAIAVDRNWTLAPAGGLRPDIWTAFPRSGPFHGFDVRLAATPGPHFVCVVAAGAGLPRHLLGCRLVTVGSNAVGVIDSVQVLAADQVTVSGWALYPSAADPVDLIVTVDGTAAGSGRALGPRPDLVGPFPAAGANHGFRLSAPAAPGPHTVCVAALVAGGAGSQVLSCWTVVVPVTQPRGALDSVWIDGDELVAAGWADDPDAGRPIDVRVVVTRDGPGDPTTVTTTANQARPDVGAALGVDAHRGYAARVTGVAAGVRTVCAIAVNERLGADRVIGCRVLALADGRPAGSLDSVSVIGSGVRVSGWFADPDVRAPISVQVRVDGITHLVVADRSRPDVAAAYPAFGEAVGFDVTVPGLGNGVHDVCVVGDDMVVGPGLSGPRSLPCGAAVLAVDYSVATSGAVSPGETVGPATGSPLERVDRDAGVSVRLRDGSTLWLFGDSMVRNDDGSLRFFVNNTAAWAAPGRPALTLDVLAAGGPVQFASPTAAFPPCSRPTDTQAMWPTSAVVVPDGPNDRVWVYLANICLGSGQQFEPRGVALAQWTYEPGAVGDGTPIVATVVDQQLFSDANQAEASVVGTDGRVYAYDCNGPVHGGWPTEYGPCTVARVEAAEVTNADQYRYWNGSSWSANRSGAASLGMPNGRDGVTNLPVGGVKVSYDAATDLYVMGYSPWPGYTTQMALRFATSPQGPFSQPLILSLPGCQDTFGGEGRFCYAAGIQPQFSTTGRLGVGWYDQLVAAPPERGAYRSGTAAVEIIRR